MDASTGQRLSCSGLIEARNLARTSVGGDARHFSSGINLVPRGTILFRKRFGDNSYA